MKFHAREFKEDIIYLVIWLILLIAPVLSLYIRTLTDTNIVFRWSEILNVWKIYAIYLAIFLIHNYILAPILIYKHRKWVYFALTVGLIALFAIYQHSQVPTLSEMRRHYQMELKQGRIPSNVNRCPHLDEEGPIPPENWGKNKQNLPNGPQFKPGDGDHLPPFLIGPRELISTIIVLLIIGMNLGIKLYFKAEEDNKEMQQLEKKNLEQQLEYLKYQINPHFFMNTLNNIHALVDIDPEKAKTTIVELSKMMRYLLYEGNQSLIPVQREIQFIKNYITLMQLRYTEKVKIHIHIPESIPDKEIPPLLLITFVENAFKHGVSYRRDSFIEVDIQFYPDFFRFTCKNSKHPESTEEHGGVGLKNVRKRLNLIYGNTYTLDISDGEDTYEVTLELPYKTDAKALG